MPAHGQAPDEVLELLTRASGSWWLAIATERPIASDTTVELADIPALQIPRDATAWALPADGVVQHLTGVDMPNALSETTAAAWCLFADEDLTDLRWSRWLTTTDSEANDDIAVPAGYALHLPPEVLELEFTPDTYPYL